MASPLPLRLTPPAALGSRLAARGGMAAALVGRGAGAFGRRPSAAIPPLACARCEGQLRALWLGSWRRSGGTEHTLLSGVEGRRLVRMFTVSTKRRSGAPKGTETEEEESKAETGARHRRPASTKRDTSSALRKMLPPMAGPALHENIYTIPNLLTASRLFAAPFIGYCILHDYHGMALSLFAYAGVTDLLDGWIARRWNLKTVVGTVIDPMADKTLMTVLTVALAMKGALPVWLAVIILGRDVALAMSAIYYRWISLPPPKTFARYWDFSLPSAEVRPTLISKYNTALQLGLMGLTTAAPVMTTVDLGTTLGIMQYVVAATTIWSGASYVYSKDAVKILTRPQPEAGEEVDKKKKKREAGE